MRVWLKKLNDKARDNGCAREGVEGRVEGREVCCLHVEVLETIRVQAARIVQRAREGFDPVGDSKVATRRDSRSGSIEVLVDSKCAQ